MGAAPPCYGGSVDGSTPLSAGGSGRDGESAGPAAVAAAPARARSGPGPATCSTTGCERSARRSASRRTRPRPPPPRRPRRPSVDPAGSSCPGAPRHRAAGCRAARSPSAAWPSLGRRAGGVHRGPASCGAAAGGRLLRGERRQVDEPRVLLRSPRPSAVSLDDGRRDCRCGPPAAAASSAPSSPAPSSSPDPAPSMPSVMPAPSLAFPMGAELCTSLGSRGKRRTQRILLGDAGPCAEILAESVRSRAGRRRARPPRPIPPRLAPAPAMRPGPRRCARACAGSCPRSWSHLLGVEAPFCHVFLQLAARLVDAPGDGPLGGAEDGRGLLVGAPVDAHQHERRAQGLREARRCPGPGPRRAAGAPRPRAGRPSTASRS